MVQLTLEPHHFDKISNFQLIALYLFHTTQEHGAMPIWGVYPQLLRYGHLQ